MLTKTAAVSDVVLKTSALYTLHSCYYNLQKKTCEGKHQVRCYSIRAHSICLASQALAASSYVSTASQAATAIQGAQAVQQFNVQISQCHLPSEQKGGVVYHGVDPWHALDGRNRTQPGVLHLPAASEMEAPELRALWSSSTGQRVCALCHT